MSSAPEEQTTLPETAASGKSLGLRYRKQAIYLLIFYVPLLVIPWILTCILAGQPALNGSNGTNNGVRYFPQTGLSPNGVLSILSWVAAARTLSSIAGVATIPVVSALLAQAAVVYTQKRKMDQKLSMRQTFVLADRRWSDITVLFEAGRTKGKGMGSRFLWLGMGLVCISAVQNPIQQLLVSWQSVPVMTCLDEAVHSCGSYPPILIGYDPEPGDLAFAGQNRIVKEVMSALPTFNDVDIETHMWPEPSYIRNQSQTLTDPPYTQMLYYWTNPEIGVGPKFFVTAMQNGTTTGVLREHAMRLNSSVKCEPVPQDQFPSTCPGRRPFTASLLSSLLDIRVCAPGEYGVFPWTLSRNRQDITEELFLDVVDNTDGRYPIASFTLHCEASTTRGYFELGNYRNNQAYGPLLEKWPTPEEMEMDFNDKLSQNTGAGYGPPTEWHGEPGFYKRQPPDPFGTGDLRMPGPLMTSAIAIFGNQSFFHVAANSSNKTYPPAAAQICQQDKIPFSNLGFTIFNEFQKLCSFINTVPRLSIISDSDSGVSALLGTWVYGFNDTSAAEEALSAAMYLSNRAMLTQTVAASFPFSAREIMFGPGMMMPLPAKTVAGTVVISLLIFLQLLGLAYVTYFIYKLPTWSHSLDAVAVARIGACLKQSDLQPLGHGAVVDEGRLNRVDGWVGLEVVGSETRLGVGAPDLVRREHAEKSSPKKRKRQRGTGN
ncbi:hypothetical protein BDW71DRAFT_200563 [Aspergillus fruticulosus]